MTTYTNTSKNSSSFTNSSKSSSTFTTTNKIIHPWQYNQSGFTYNQTIDPNSIYQIYYDSIGDNTFVWTESSK